VPDKQTKSILLRAQPFLTNSEGLLRANETLRPTHHRHDLCTLLL